MHRTHKKASTLSSCLLQQNRALAITAEITACKYDSTIGNPLPRNGCYNIQHRMKQKRLNHERLQQDKLLAHS